MYQFGMDYFLGSFGPIAMCMRMTLVITLSSFVLAFVFSIILALLLMSKNKVIQSVLKVWISLFRGTPLLCQLFLFCYGILPYIPGIKNCPLEVQATICMALSFSAYMAETIRGAILSVDAGQMEACITTGMTTIQAYRYVVLPQAFRLAIPASLCAILVNWPYRNTAISFYLMSVHF